MAEILVVFIFCFFQKGFILSGHTLCAALFIAVLLLKNRLFGLVGPTLIKHEKKSNRTILLQISSRIGKIYVKSLILRG